MTLQSQPTTYDALFRVADLMGSVTRHTDGGALLKLLERVTALGGDATQNSWAGCRGRCCARWRPFTRRSTCARRMRQWRSGS